MICQCCVHCLFLLKTSGQKINYCRCECCVFFLTGGKSVFSPVSDQMYGQVTDGALQPCWAPGVLGGRPCCSAAWRKRPVWESGLCADERLRNSDEARKPTETLSLLSHDECSLTRKLLKATDGNSFLTNPLFKAFLHCSAGFVCFFKNIMCFYRFHAHVFLLSGALRAVTDNDDDGDVWYLLSVHLFKAPKLSVQQYAKHQQTRLSSCNFVSVLAQSQCSEGHLVPYSKDS